jgi:hypothetical protein
MTSDLLKPRNAYPGDLICILRRDVETSIGQIKRGTEITPMSFGSDASGRSVLHWSVQGQDAVYTVPK